jgi:diguanylate cyclase (GGDEF)-like protein/PAS domain S-box-containing protein
MGTFIAQRGEFKFVNPQFARIAGRPEEELLGSKVLDLVPVEEHERIVGLSRSMLRGELTQAIEHRIAGPTGEARWVLTTVSMINYEGGRALLGNTIDVTERQQARNLFETLAGSSPVGIFIVQDGVLQFVNPEMQRLTGYGEDELVGQDPLILVPENEREDMALSAEALLSGARRHPYEHRFTTRTGETRWLMETFTPIEYRGRPAILGNTIDITERKMFEERLAHQAFYDQLTDLPNRTLFMARLEHALAGAARRGESVAVMFLDLDGFKSTNDSLGHAAGDQLLALIGTRLQSCLRPGDTVARIGGDEFTILLDTLTRQEDALRVSERVVEEMQRPFDVGGEQMVVTASVGLAFSEPGRSGPGDLLREADVALYHAKASGKARYSVFSDPAKRHAA